MCGLRCLWLFSSGSELFFFEPCSLLLTLTALAPLLYFLFISNFDHHRWQHVTLRLALASTSGQLLFFDGRRYTFSEVLNLSFVFRLSAMRLCFRQSLLLQCLNIPQFSLNPPY